MNVQAKLNQFDVPLITIEGLTVGQYLSIINALDKHRTPVSEDVLLPLKNSLVNLESRKDLLNKKKNIVLS